jgi:hypothetical protein
MAHHKVAALASQPRQGGELKRHRATARSLELASLLC